MASTVYAIKYLMPYRCDVKVNLSKNSLNKNKFVCLQFCV